MQLNDTSPEVEEKQIQMLRKAATAQRFARARSLTNTVIYLSRRAIGRNQPSFSDREIKLKFISLHYGKELAENLRDASLKIYTKARDIAEKREIIIADTKFEFGIYDDKLILIDELLTPDSSRFWSLKDYAPGKGQDSYDKQIVRDYLLTLDWDKTYPGPALPEEIIEKAARRYNEILKIISGKA